MAALAISNEVEKPSLSTPEDGFDAIVYYMDRSRVDKSACAIRRDLERLKVSLSNPGFRMQCVPDRHNKAYELFHIPGG